MKDINQALNQLYEGRSMVREAEQSIKSFLTGESPLATWKDKYSTQSILDLINSLRHNNVPDPQAKKRVYNHCVKCLEFGTDAEEIKLIYTKYTEGEI